MEQSNSSEKTKQGNISRQKYLWVIGSFTLIGVIGGYAYYALVGCNLEGGCAMKSNPYLMMIWGGLMGYLVPDMFLKPHAEEPNQQHDGSSQK
jgi:uncharacterized membrane protein YhaH (DUF805 family)